MKPFTENEKSMSNRESNKTDKINRERIEQIATAFNHQKRVEHIDKTTAQFNALFARLNASKIGEK